MILPRDPLLISPHLFRLNHNSLQIPYTLSDNLSQNDRLTIAKAMDHIEEDTCVKFVPRGLNPYYVDIAR